MKAEISNRITKPQELELHTCDRNSLVKKCGSVLQKERPKKKKKKGSKQNIRDFLKSLVSLAFFALCSVLYSFKPWSQVYFFFCQKYLHRKKKKVHKQSHMQSAAQLTPVWIKGFVSSVAQIPCLDVSSYSASLNFTFTLKRFISHFLQPAILDNQTPVSDICTCPRQQTPRWRPQT